MKVLAICSVLLASVAVASSAMSSCARLDAEPTTTVVLPLPKATNKLEKCQSMEGDTAEVRYMAVEAADGTKFFRRNYYIPDCSNKTTFEDVPHIYRCSDYTEEADYNSFAYNSFTKICTIYLAGANLTHVSCEGHGQVIFVADPLLNQWVFDTTDIQNFEAHVHHDHIDLEWDTVHKVCNETAKLVLKHGDEEIELEPDTSGYTIKDTVECVEGYYNLSPVNSAGVSVGPTVAAKCSYEYLE